MTFATFKQIIDLQSKQHQKIHKLYVLGLDLMDFYEDSEKAIDLLWKDILTVDGESWLSWFVFEKDYISGELREDFKAFDGDVEICKDLEGLYKYLVSNNYFR